jgi:hypothetical protein
MPNIFRRLFRARVINQGRKTSCHIDGKEVELSPEEANDISNSLDDVSKEMDTAFEGFGKVFDKMDVTFDKINKKKEAL